MLPPHGGTDGEEASIFVGDMCYEDEWQLGSLGGGLGKVPSLGNSDLHLVTASVRSPWPWWAWCEGAGMAGKVGVGEEWMARAQGVEGPGYLEPKVARR